MKGERLSVMSGLGSNLANRQSPDSLGRRSTKTFFSSIKVSRITVGVAQIAVMKTEFTRYQALRFWLTPSSHSRKGRIVRSRTHSTCLIGGSQTVEHSRDSRTFCVKCWSTHPIPAHLRVSLASSMRLTMTIRKGLTPTTLNYRRDAFVV